MGRLGSVILVVDDDRRSREGLSEFLSLHGFTVRCAANGREALDFLHHCERQPSLILLDLMMPVLDGWGFLAEQRNDPALARVPVVVMSGLYETAASTRQYGTVAVLPKPLDAQILLHLIKHRLKRLPHRGSDRRSEPSGPVHGSTAQ